MDDSEFEGIPPVCKRVLDLSLKYEWAFWLLSEDEGKRGPVGWNDRLKTIGKFRTIGQFWELYNKVPLASALNDGCDYSIFHSDIQPTWEDPQNCKGGRFRISIKQRRDRQMTQIDMIWKELLMMIVGETFGDYRDHICGVVFNSRISKGDKISIWTKDAGNKDAIESIGKILKSLLNELLPNSDNNAPNRYGSPMPCTYEPHRHHHSSN